jgi:hypothetical protein
MMTEINLRLLKFLLLKAVIKSLLRSWLEETPALHNGYLAST